MSVGRRGGLQSTEEDVIYEAVKANYALPLEGYPFQVETVNELGPLPRAGYYLDPGVGKTFCSTVAALYKRDTRKSQTIVVMPPILLDGWAKFLNRIPGIRVLVYRGNPKQRKEMDIGADFILMSTQILKQDFDRLDKYFRDEPVTLIIDEASSIKNISSANHKMTHNFVLNHDCDLMLLTGTPLTTPADAYAYIKLIAPGTYRNLGQFEKIHVAERDFFNKVTKWQHLDVMASNMAINSKRVIKEHVLTQLQPVTYTPMFYELAPKHLKLYNKLAEEQLLLLEDGGKIDATSAPALWSALQQIILNYAHFSQEEGARSAGYDLLDEVLAELGDRKLLVFANYRMSNRALVEYTKPYQGVAIFGDISAAQKQKNIQTFINVKTCRVLVAQPTSGGYGVDGLQDVCSDVLFLEAPRTSTEFEQALARLYRNGQMKGVHCRIAVANKTLQVSLHKALLDKDDLVTQVQGKFNTLRDMIYGG